MAETITKTKAAVVTKVKGKDDKDLRRSIKENAALGHKADYNIAKELAEAFLKDLWQMWGFSSFDAYVEHDLPMMHPRKARHFVNMGKVINQHKITESQLIGVDWTKLKEVSNLMTDDMPKSEVNDLIDFAKENTFDDVAKYVKKERVKRSGGKHVESVTMTFKFSGEQAAVVEQAIATYTERYTATSPSQALEALCLEALTEGSNDPKKIALIKGNLTEEKVERVKQKERSDKGKAATKKAAKTAKKIGKKADA